jgi:exosortase A
MWKRDIIFGPAEGFGRLYSDYMISFIPTQTCVKEARVYQWRGACWLFLASSVVVMALFWNTTHTMVNMWAHSRTYAHGFLVLPSTLYIVWCSRERLLGLSPVPNSWGPVLLAVLACSWLGGVLTQILLIQQVAVVAMIPALVLTVFGRAVLQVLRFPLGFLAFALPVGTSFEPMLQSVTAQFIVTGLKIAGIPLSREGYFITIPSGTWEVAPDCGGLRYLLPGLALGYLYTGVIHQKVKYRIGFLLSCAVLLILANGIRAYGIILGDHLGIAEGTDHRVFSYAVYGVTMLLLAWLGLKWSDSGIQHRIVNVQQADPRSTCGDVLRQC